MKKYVFLVVFALLLLCQFGLAGIAGAVDLRIDPADTVLPANGMTFDVDVVLDNVTDLGGYQFDIDYPPLIVEIANASDVVEGACLGSTGRTTIPLAPVIDNVAGSLTYGVASIGAAGGFTGSNCILATVTFTVVGQNTGTLDLNASQVTDTAAASQTIDSETDGSLVLCQVDADCDDGLFCNGTETCNAGVCGAVSACPPAIDGCVTRNNTCDEVNDTCVDFADDSQCDDGLLCNGSETCNIGTGLCDAGTPLNCDDSVGCTDDSCNDATGCINTANDSNCADDGVSCNGTEFCDAVNDCSSTNDVCSVGEVCDVPSDSCILAIGPSTPVPAMSGWGMISFVVLAALGSLYFLRRRKRV